MQFEWDPIKARAKLAKHGVRFGDAVSVFSDENAITIQEDHASEDRRLTLGMDALARLLVVAYNWTPTCIRIISAREANRRERTQYGE